MLFSCTHLALALGKHYSFQFIFYFRSLLDNQILLEQFLDNEDQDVVVDKVDNAANGKYERNQNRDPEASFLRISSHLRQALKKHFPLVSAKLFLSSILSKNELLFG